jgi:Mg-chelatase subunit ChlD
VADFSESIRGHENEMVDAVNTFASVVNGEGIRTGVVLFASEPKLVSGLTNDVGRLISLMDYYRNGYNEEGYFTNIQPALQMATNLLLEDQRNSRKLVILISDGWITKGPSPSETVLTVKQMNAVGVFVCSVFITTYNELRGVDFLKEISGGCYAESGYMNLAEELKKLNICF